MKFKCDKNIIQEAIITAQKAVTGKSTMNILQGILIRAAINEITITGSDMDLSIETRFDAEVFETGNIVVDSKLFGDIIRKLPSAEVEITTLENNTLEIVCQKSIFSLTHMNADEYPIIPIIDENMVFKISRKILKNMIKGTIFAAAVDETRPILTGILFEVINKKLNLVALDGFRLALRSENVESDDNISAVIPAKTLSEVSKIIDDTDNNINITFTQNQILFNLDKTKIISRLLVGEFIKYDSIIPHEYNLKIIAKRDALQDCIERASLLAKDGNTNLVKFDIKEDNLIITSNSQLGKVKEEINIILQGESLQIAFNSKYLIDLLKIMEEQEVIMEFSSSVSPCVVKNKENDNCTYLILPVRLLAN
jgi:DNA polymerase III subunit beta